MLFKEIHIIGAGLAGCEAAWQLAKRCIPVKLYDMKPKKRTPAQRQSSFAELVCSNSLRSMNPENAVGLLKEEMSDLGSLIIEQAHQHRVPAGDALAVNRLEFSQSITQRLQNHPYIQIITHCEEKLKDLSEGYSIIATGPLTDTALAKDILSTSGCESLAFYDALAPIVSADSLDLLRLFAASRYDKGDSNDYLNCPLDKTAYETFYHELRKARCLPFHDFEKPHYFQGCQPIEVIAATGVDALRYGCMKPVGLHNPHTPEKPYAVIQLRKEDKHGQSYNLVGFQTKMTYAEQARIFKMIPGLEQAQFLRYGTMHRNTYLNSPSILDRQMRLRSRPHLRFAGQITGVEGYVESAAHGLLTALSLFYEIRYNKENLPIPPATTALGALWAHVCGDNAADRMPQDNSKKRYEPHNIHWGLFTPLEGVIKKSHKKQKRLEKAREDFLQWRKNYGF